MYEDIQYCLQDEVFEALRIVVNNAQIFLGKSSRARSGSVCRRPFVPADKYLLSTWQW